MKRRRLSLVMGIVVGIVLAILEPRGIARLTRELRARLERNISGGSTGTG